MTGQLEVAPATMSPPDREDTRRGGPGWRPLTRVAFRFCLVYTVLFFLTEMRIAYPLLGVFAADLPPAVLSWQYHAVGPIVDWVAANLVHAPAPLLEPVQSGDQAFFWVLTLTWSLVALLITLVWSVLDRHRPGYPTAFGWWRVVVRMCLAAQLFSFGFAKVFPLQMSLPLTRLVEPFGDFSPMNVLWSQVGSSPLYEVLLGCAEVTAGLLLVIPRTALLGALLAAVELTQVLVLNIAYEVPLKIFTLHLLGLALLLVAPDAVRLARVLFSDRGVGPVTRPAAWLTARGAHVALVAQLLVGLWLAGSQVHREWTLWNAIGVPGPKPPLYGIWDVTEFSMDGQVRPPLTTDTQRWRRLIVDTTHSYQLQPVSSQRMDGSIVDHDAVFDPPNRTLTLADATDPAWSAQLVFDQTTPDALKLDGTLDGHTVQITLTKVDVGAFAVTGGGVRWVQDAPLEPRKQPR